MGKKKFGRIAEITIFPQKGGNAVIISNLSIKFKITKTRTSESNNATITIYNLSKNTADQISDTDINIQVKAGYEQATGLELVFVGDIVDVKHSSNGTNEETVIKAKDGGMAIRDAKINKSYSSGVDLRQMIKDGIKSLNLPVKIPIDKIPIPKIKTNNNQIVSGSSKSFLDKITTKAGYDWVINDGVVELVKKKGVDKKSVAVISSSSGMLGVPKKISINKDGKKTDGWEVSSLLLPNVLPLSVVEVRSDQAGTNGQYQVIEIQHSGNNQSGDWYSNLKVIEL